ncbi:MAG: hypothetical protein K5866_10375 [Treponema sp.]|nr:hypothetical protein [Treponema sp.]
MKKTLLCTLLFLLSFNIFAEKPLVKDIQAIAGKGTKINIIWTNPQNPDEEITSYLLYRSTKPITKSQELADATLIAELPAYSTSYTDSVKDYKDYFYAVITKTDKINDLILPTINSLSIGVHLNYSKKESKSQKAQKEKLYPEGSLREKPLPYIDYIEGLNEEEIISEETLDITKKLSSTSKNQSKILEPYYFEEDLVSPDAGDDYLLFDILKTYFVKKNYKDSLLMLKRLVRTNIKEVTRKRAYFYIGQAQYFSGDYEEAVKTFVQIEKDYPILAKKWIDSSLDNMN